MKPSILEFFLKINNSIGLAVPNILIDKLKPYYKTKMIKLFNHRFKRAEYFQPPNCVAVC